MKRRISTFFAIAAFAMAAVLGSTEGLAQYAWITDEGHNQVVGIGVQLLNRIEFSGRLRAPWGVAVTADGSRVYVTLETGTVWMIEPRIDGPGLSKVPQIAATPNPRGIAVTPGGTRVYVAGFDNNVVLAIDTTSMPPIVKEIDVAGNPLGVAVNPQGTRVYVTQYSLGSVAVIATVDNSLITTIPLKNGASNYPFGVAVNPKDGSASGSINRVYVTNSRSGTVSVIDTMIG
jgi:YVTN family beta-propeller protein